MLILQIAGGLGNQLNTYALYIWLKNRGKAVKLDKTYYSDQYKIKGGSNVNRELELNRLSLTYDCCTQEQRYKYTDDDMHLLSRIKRLFRGHHPNYIDIETFTSKDDILNYDEGYVIGAVNPATYCEKDVLEVIRKMVKYPKEASTDIITQKNQEMLKLINSTEAVAIHIRRTDYLKPENQYLNIATKEYINSAIEYIKTRKPNAEFFVFSDDKEYVTSEFNEEGFHIVDFNEEKDCIFDLMLMSNCKHIITAKSTFSQWAARLNSYEDKIVIVPVEGKIPSYVIEKDFVWIDTKGNVVNL